jgi:hypothetical protein
MLIKIVPNPTTKLIDSSTQFFKAMPVSSDEQLLE